MSPNEIVIGAHRLRPFVVSADSAVVAAARAAGHDAQDAFSASGEPWFKALRELDAALFRDSGQALPAWVFFDCAMAPGVVVGLALPDDAPSHAPDPGAVGRLRLVTLGIAIPTAAPQVQLVHTLASLDLGAPADTEAALEATWRLLRAVAHGGTGEGSFVLTTPWSGPLVPLVGSHGAAVLAAHMPANDIPETLTVGVGPAFPPRPASAEVLVLQRDDVAAMAALQRQLEAGTRAWLEPAPERVTADSAVRIRTSTDAAAEGAPRGGNP